MSALALPLVHSNPELAIDESVGAYGCAGCGTPTYGDDYCSDWCAVNHYHEQQEAIHQAALARTAALPKLHCFTCGGEGAVVELRSGEYGQVLCPDCRGRN